ncbi:MAG: DNA mismatch repair endonuclease MutL [Lachnospiraceae bacterium]|nr:DNA mismatch repair endonuclease MutL [Lachnospiraceae bacterium]
MNEIHILDSNTVDQIAAGEVVERPASVVKELVENAIDAGAKHITVEIKDGGISFIRVTDDGGGIDESQLSKVFMRHATSKISMAEDLETVMSLGFRGEALSSISAVCQVELITKTPQALTGHRMCISGGETEAPEEIGAPDGTTILVRNIFFNTPVRRKFLKTAATEGGYIADFMQHMALSVPDVAFQFVANGQTKFFTSGNGNMNEIIYRIYGKDVASEMIPVDAQGDGIRITGFIGKPVLNRANRSYETFFVNKRYIKSSLISSAVEEGYKTFLMQHKYPFVVLHFDIDPTRIDVNVHPTKMDIRMNEPGYFLSFIRDAVKDALTGKTFIASMEQMPNPEKKNDKAEEKALTAMIPQPFEQKRREEIPRVLGTDREFLKHMNVEPKPIALSSGNVIKQKDMVLVEKLEQLKLFDEEQIKQQEIENFKIIGQVFDTYWILSMPEKIYYVDQHAAHEKVMYERLMRQYREKEIAVQSLNPPLVVTLSPKEKNVLLSHMDDFASLGFEMDEFGEDAYAIRSVPTDLYGLSEKQLFLSILDELVEFPVKGDSDAVLSKIASMSCKAAVKGNQAISMQEAEALMKELLACENPFNCPHGRPTIISMTKYELEKKFKR